MSEHRLNQAYVTDAHLIELRTAELAELVQLRAFERGLLVLECGESSVRVSPPLVITRDQAAAALKILAEVFGAVTA